MDLLWIFIEWINEYLNKTTNIKTKNDFGTMKRKKRKKKKPDSKLGVCSTNVHSGYGSRCQIISSRKPRHKTNQTPLVSNLPELSNNGSLTDFKRDPFPRTQRFHKWLLLTEAYKPQVFQNLFNTASRPPYTGVSRSTGVGWGGEHGPQWQNPCFEFISNFRLSWIQKVPQIHGWNSEKYYGFS